MSYIEIDTAHELNTLIYDDTHITLYVTFTYNSVPVDVSSPSFILKNSQGQSVGAGIKLLKPLQKDPNVSNTIGKYIVTFLSSGLTSGNYTAEFTGTYETHPISSTTALTLFEQPREQYLIDLLRGSIGGKYNAEVPNQYYTIDPSVQQWSDGRLYIALLRSLNAINSIPPGTEFTFDDIPCINYLIVGGQLYALTALATLEDTNYYDITIPVKVTFYKGDKLRALAQFIRDEFQQPVKEWKHHWWMENEAESYSVIMKRTPVRLTRPVSDNLFFHSVAW